MEIGEYVVDFMSIIGRGAFGTVYKGSHKATKEEVAVKQIPLSHDDVDAHDSYLHDIVQAEKEALKSLKDHPNIVRLLKFVLKDDAVYLIMEYCDLGPLNGYLKRNKELNLSAKLKIMIQATSAVAFMHAQKPPIIHRDLKLENILLRMNNGEVVVKVADFGLARLCDERQWGSMSSFANAEFTASVVGTRYFQAPELLREDEKTTYDSSVDVFALGLTCVVVYDFNTEYTKFLPLSVSAKASGKEACFGTEMLECQKERKTIPVITEILSSDDAIVKDLKQLFLKMTAFRPKDRQQIRTVHKQLEKLLDRQQAKDTEHKDDKIEGITATLAEQKAISARASVSKTTKPLAVLLSDLSTLSFTKTRQVELPSTPRSVHLLGDTVWSCCDSGIAIHDRELKHQRTILAREDTGYILSAAQTSDDTVTVGAGKGLFLINKEGKILQKMDEGLHGYVCVHAGSLYTTIDNMKKKHAEVHVYSTDTWERTSVIQHPCIASTRHAHPIQVNDQHIMLSCSERHNFHKLSLDGRVINTYSRSVNSKVRLTNPRLCMQDGEGSVLIADWGNDRVRVLDGGEQWSELQLQPQPARPCSVVSDGKALFVLSWAPDSLIKYIPVSTT